MQGLTDTYQDACRYSLIVMLHTVQDSLSPLGRQLEMCLARQVQVQNAKRHGPLQVLMTDKKMVAAAAAAAGGASQRFGPIPWPHPSQQSLDSQVSRMQLAQAALEKADMFKVGLCFLAADPCSPHLVIYC